MGKADIMVLPHLFLAGFILVCLRILVSRQEERRRRAFLLGQDSPTLLDRWCRLLSRTALTRHLMDRLSLTLELSISEPWQHPEEGAAFLLGLIPLGFGAIGTIFVFSGRGIMQTLQDLFLLALVLMLVSTCVHLAVREKFRRRLPGIYRVLNSRYLVCGDMMEALKLVQVDTHGRMNRLVGLIRDSLLLNDMIRRREILEGLRRKYNDPYFTLLLYLLQQAVDKGGREAVMHQFIETAEECLLDMEYRKNLRVPARTYTALIGVFMVLFFGVIRFNTNALGDQAFLFYQSGASIWYQTVFFLVASGGVLILQLLEGSF